MPRKRQPKVRICEFCGHPFSIERGPAAKTCSEECQRDRNNAIEKARYQRVKGSEQWKAVRSNYLQQLKKRLAEDPAFAEIWRAQHQQSVRKHRASTTDTEALKKAKRIERAHWRKWLMTEPMAWEAHKFKSRAWYAGLSAEEKVRIFGVKKPAL